MPYNSENSQYERRATTVIDATPDGDTVAVAIDVKLDQGIDDYVADINHHAANGRHYPATSVASDSRFLKQSPAGVVSWADGVVAADAALKDFSNVASGAISNDKLAIIQNDKLAIIKNDKLAPISPSKIAQDASNRFTTDAEKSTWNGVASETVVGRVELATAAEAAAGTGTSMAVTPAGMLPCLSSARYLHVRDEKTSGTNGGTSSNSTWHTRDLNTVKSNTISGASVAANAITIPAGKYYLKAKAPAYRAARHRIRIITDAGATQLLFGGACYTDNTQAVLTNATLEGVFNTNSEKTLTLSHYIQSGVTTDGLGLAMSSTLTNEVYSEVEIWKIG